ncbi:hypothetical protein HD806DRAFT_520196 [Xylariaceae sp. AK1471]|nr:hypothetical protein HD806DRAFT_520196 [Xylariaceae sp. AK1471]
MLSDARGVFWNAIHAYPWVSSLANILPLSDFIDIPRTLHAFELNGAAPLWCWPIAPAGSRLILSPHTTEDPCCLDKFGSSPSLICLDGRWGDVYQVASPETLRLCLATAPLIRIDNNNSKMTRDGARIQKLTVVRVSRIAGNTDRQIRQHSWSFVGGSVFGWVILIGLIIFSGLMHCWLSLAFLIVVPATGAVVSLTRGGKPRELRPGPPGKYNRILAFYGESNLINSLLNHRLRRRRFLNTHSWLFGATLRILLLRQWALAIGAAALQAWDAYLRTARLRFERFETILSGRRALLNTIMALNPDTFAVDPNTKQENHETLYEDVIKRSSSSNGTKKITVDGLEDGNWAKDYRGFYWHKSILEGILIAKRIAERAGSMGRFVK